MKAIYSVVFLAVTFITSAVAAPATIHPGLQQTTADIFGRAEMARPGPKGTTHSNPAQHNPAQHGHHDAPAGEKHDHDKHGNSKGSKAGREVLASQSYPSKSSGKDDHHSGKDDHHGNDKYSGKGAKSSYSARAHGHHHDPYGGYVHGRSSDTELSVIGNVLHHHGYEHHGSGYGY